MHTQGGIRRINAVQIVVEEGVVTSGVKRAMAVIAAISDFSSLFTVFIV